MAKPVNPPRGMRDFLPEDKTKREAVLSVIRATYRAHGFDEIETPVMEDSDRLHAGLGGDNEKLAFGVLRRGLTAEDLAAADRAARPSRPRPAVRPHRSAGPVLCHPPRRAAGGFRAVQIAPVWRAERPQKGRYRQFLQCDIDIIGEAGPLAEIELIRATGATLDALGLTGWSIRLNDRRILHRILDSWGVPADSRDSALVSLDKEDKIGVAGVAAELHELGLADPHRVTETLEQLKSLPDDGWALGAPDWLDAAAYADLVEIRAAVPDVPVVFSPNLVRGMGYYTGAIFEIAHPSSTSSLGGGGRYDGMIGRFLGTDVPATGFSIGFERVLDLIDLGTEKARMPSRSSTTTRCRPPGWSR